MNLHYMRPALKFNGSTKGVTNRNTGQAPIASTVRPAPMMAGRSGTAESRTRNTGMQVMPMEKRQVPRRR